MENRRINKTAEKKLEADIALFSKLTETEKAFIMGAIWNMVANKKSKPLIN